MAPQLILVRHGQSYGNLTGDYSTRRHDNLTDAGWAQARALAAHWASAPDLVVVSPLARTRQTARPTLERWGGRAELWSDLAEACWQEPRSLPPSDPELAGDPVDLDAEEAAWYGPGPFTSPPDHERWQDGLRRMRRAAVALDGAARAEGGRTVLAFSHGYAISKLIILLTGRGDIGEVFDLANASVSRLSAGPGEAWTLEAFNSPPPMVR